MLLTSQPGIVGFGDTYFSSQNKPANPCTCGKPYLECPVRQKIESHAREHGLADFSFFEMQAVPTPRSLSKAKQRTWPLHRAASLPAVRAIPGSLRRRIFSTFYRETELMLEALDDLGEYEVYFDGCKNLVRLELLRSASTSPKALHVIRHPGAYLWHFQRKGEADLGRRLAGWLRYHTRARDFRERLGPEDYRVVTYEHIVKQPASFLNEIAAFLGASRIAASEPVELRHEGVHVMGNSMRRQSTRVINMADRWRGKLDPTWSQKACELVARTRWLAELFPDERAA
jgi:hypothetical protein